MKRTAYFIIVFFICFTASRAQTKQQEYGKLVDYVKCYYTVNYIGNNIGELPEGDRTRFERTKNIFNKNVISYSDINLSIDATTQNASSFLKTLNGFANVNNRPKALWSYIEAKKGKYQDNWTKSEMIDFLIFVSDKEIIIQGVKSNFEASLKESTTSLKAKLKEQIPDNFFTKSSAQASEEKKTDNDAKPDTETQHVGESFSSRSILTVFKTILIIIVILAILFAGMRIYNKFIKQRKADRVSNVPTATGKVKEEISYKKLTDQYHALESDYKTLQEHNKMLLAERNELERKYKNLKQQMKKTRKDTVTVDCDNDYQDEPQPISYPTVPQKEDSIIPVQKKPVESFSSTLYADAIIDGCFNRVINYPNEDTIFVMRLQNAQTAIFTVYPGAEQLVVKRPEFLEGCDRQTLNNARYIKIESEGLAQQQANGKWNIIKKLNVVIK